MTGKAFAKLNISLDIVSKRPDGYHGIMTVMQSVGLYDEVTVEIGHGDGITAVSDLHYLPSDERNIAHKAARVFLEHSGIRDSRVSIRIKKRIPVCAGLGGGSSDAACVLRLLNQLFSTAYNNECLRELGSRIGSDVPFCVEGGTVLASGRGDQLTPLPAMPDCAFVIVKPPFSMSTPELFSRITVEKIRARPDTDGIVSAIMRSDLSGIARRMYNVFESVLPRGGREIQDIKYRLLDLGALGSVMTGSGSAVYGIFEDYTQAVTAHGKLGDTFGGCFAVRPVPEPKNL